MLRRGRTISRRATHVLVALSALVVAVLIFHVAVRARGPQAKEPGPAAHADPSAAHDVRVDPPTVESSSASIQTSFAPGPVVYGAASVTLEPGTWLIEGSATVLLTNSKEGALLGLYDSTADADVPDSFGAVHQPAAPGTLFALATSKIVSVSKRTEIRLKAYPGAGGTIAFGNVNELREGAPNLPGVQRLTAARLQ
jgi:hypothetical protein